MADLYFGKISKSLISFTNKIIVKKAMEIKHQIPIENLNFQKIIKFYLFECPVETKQKVNVINNGKKTQRTLYRKVSHRGKSFKERKLKRGDFISLKAAMIRSSYGLILSASNEEPKSPNVDEYIVIKKNEDHVNIIEGYFYCLRNGFAHGSFDVNGNYYIFENSYEGKLKGIARLKENTLLEWIDLCSMSPTQLKKYKR